MCDIYHAGLATRCDIYQYLYPTGAELDISPDGIERDTPLIVFVGQGG